MYNVHLPFCAFKDVVLDLAAGLSQSVPQCPVSSSRPWSGQKSYKHLASLPHMWNPAFNCFQLENHLPSGVELQSRLHSALTDCLRMGRRSELLLGRSAVDSLVCVSLTSHTVCCTHSAFPRASAGACWLCESLMPSITDGKSVSIA